MNSRTKKLTATAMLCAIAFVVMWVSRALPNIVLFLKYDPKDVVIIIGGFIYGPATALIISVIVSILEMLTVSTTGVIGLLMNILSSCAYACTAAWLYKRRHTIKGAVVALIIGALLATIAMILWNYIITPLYMNYPRAAVAELLLPVFLPFNILKNVVNGTLVVLLYKPIVVGLRKTHLVPPSASGNKTKINWWLILPAFVVLITCILLTLIYMGIL